MPQGSPSLAGGWHLGWAVVFAANLIFPMLLGWGETRDGGRTGMFAAVALLWLAGHLAIVRRPGLRLVLVAGGVCTAVTQLCPVLQFMAGAISLDVVGHPVVDRPEDGQPDPGPLSDGQGFAATLLTGAQLLVVATLCGLVIRGFRPAAGAESGASDASAGGPV